MSMTIVSGHITADATSKQVNTQNGLRYVTTFTVADNGNPNKPEFLRFSAWSNQPTKLAQYARKGRAVTCIGQGVHASAYKDRNGNAAASLDLTLQNITWMDSGAKYTEAAQPTQPPMTAIPNVVPAEAVETAMPEAVVLPF